MTTKNRNVIATCFVAASLLAALPGCHRLEQMASTLSDRRDAFTRLPVGIQGATREQVIAAMGQPKSMRTLGVIGIGQGELLEFSDATNQYQVLVINNCAVMKNAAPHSAEKAQELQS